MTDRQDFFADLERQLVAAAGDRRARLRRARRRSAATASAIVLALLAAGGGIAAAVGTSDQDGRGTPARSTSLAAPPLSAKTRDILARQEVAVLNATTIPGLGRGVANRLHDANVKVGNVANAAEQGRSVSCVTYVPGHEQAALRVAALIDISPYNVGIATRAERVRAGDRATVIVTVGSDQNIAARRAPDRTP